jgi:ABC-type uncharacterized transport system ATPase subunit
MQVLLKARGITKRFGNLVANDGIDFELRRGEIHALLGENGAGKTTFCNILYGYLKPDQGQIELEGKQVRINSPKEAMRLGIGMVHQDFMLIPNMTVCENLSLLLDPVISRPILDLTKIRDRIKSMSLNYGLKVDPDSKIENMTAGERQMVEILKCLFLNAKILIFDEPTSHLTGIETEKLFSSLKLMRDEGRSIIFVTHKIDEVTNIADRVTVLRNGRVVSTAERKEVTKEKLASMIIGRELQKITSLKSTFSDSNVLILEGVSAKNELGVNALKEVSLTLKRGEILAIAGVTGNGQRELDEVITGMRKVTSGKIILDGKEITNLSADRIRREGVAHICEEHKTGFIFNMSLKENLIISPFLAEKFKRGLFIDHDKLENTVKELIREFNIAARSPEDMLGTLSGGNRQKFLLARELFWGPKVIVANNPTKGLDIAASSYIRERLLKARSEGKSVLLISSDLDEVLEIADRIAVINSGRIVDITDASSVDINRLAYMMTKS